MGKIVKSVMSVVSKVMPILQIASFVFPVIAPFTAMLSTAMTAINTAKNVIKGGFPKGLIQGALSVASNYLPGPMAKVTEFAQGKLDALKALVPAAVKNIVPAVKMPVAAGIGNWV